MVELVKQYATEQAEQQAPALLDQVIAYLPLVFLLMIAVIVVIVVVRWWFNKKQKDSELYKEEYRETINECLVCKNDKWIKSIAGLPRFLATKGVPIYVNYPQLTHSKQYKGRKLKKGEEKSEELFVEQSESYLIGSYAGHSTGTDGCRNLLIKSHKDKILGIIPKLLIIKIRLPHKQKIINPDDRQKTKVLDVPPDNVSFSTDMIVINAMGLEKINEYWYCVNMDGEGNIVDNKAYVYNDLIDIAVQKQVIDIGKNMAKMVDESVKSNSIVQFLKKTDSSLGQD